jgi:hypothetical protein
LEGSTFLIFASDSPTYLSRISGPFTIFGSLKKTKKEKKLRSLIEKNNLKYVKNIDINKTK